MSTRRQRFTFLLAKGLSAREAAREVGYSESYVRKSWKVKRASATEIAQAEHALREVAQFDLTQALKESLEVIQFAKEHKNAMAYFKAVEHRAKLCGLLVDRIQVEKVDIRAALLEAEARLVKIPSA